MADKLQIPPIRTPLTDADGSPATDKSWYYYWQTSASRVNDLLDLVDELQGQPEEPPPVTPPGTAPDAPNVTATTPAVTFQLWANETIPVFSGTINYPTTDPDYDLHWQRVDVEAIDPSSGKAIYLNSYPKPSGGGASGPYSGYNEQILQTLADRPGWKLRFTSYNEDGRPTLPPYETALFTIQRAEITAISAIDDRPSRWKDFVQALHAVVPVTVTLLNYPHHVTVWTDSPQYGRIWHGSPQPVTAGSTVIPIGARNSGTEIYPPTGIGVTGETVTVYVALGVLEKMMDPATAPGVVSTTVVISAPDAPGVNDARNAWIEHVQYYSVGGGVNKFGWRALHITVDTIDDAEFWFIRFHIQSGHYVGGVWTPGGQFGASESGFPGIGLGDWATSDDHDTWISRTPGTNDLVLTDNGGWPVPSDINLTFKVTAMIASRRNGPDGTVIVQNCWSSAVDVSTPGTAAFQDVVVDPAMGTGDGTVPLANVLSIAAVETGPRYADRNQGQHTVVKLTPTLDSPTLGNNVTFWLQFGDGKWVRQGVWLINDTITSVTLGEQTLGTEGQSGAGDIWVPTADKRRTWVAAAKETNVETDDPPAGAPTVTFDVPPVGACPADDITDIHFLINPNSGDEMVYVMKDTWKWFYYELDMTQPTFEHDNNYWFAFITVETGYNDTGGVWHSQPGQEGMSEAGGLYIGRKHNDAGELQGGHPIYGSILQFKGGDVSDYWDEPPLEFLDGTPYPYWTVRFRVYAVSRLGTDADGGDGTMTLQTGWPGGADHYDLTPDVNKMPGSINLKNLNPGTSFPPGSVFTGGAGSPVDISIAAPLANIAGQIAITTAAAGGGIDSPWIKDGAVTARTTALAAINPDGTLGGVLKANSVVDGLVKLPVSQLTAKEAGIFYGTAIFTDNVYLSRGTGYPVVALEYSAITLYGSGDASGNGIASGAWTRITSSATLLYGGDVSGHPGPSTLLTGGAITLYTRNGDLNYPNFGLSPTALSFFYPPYFSLVLSAAQIQLTYDNSGQTCGTPIVPAPATRFLCTNTLSSLGWKIQFQQTPLPAPPNNLIPTAYCQSNFIQFWTYDNNTSYPAVGIQGDQLTLVYGNYSTVITSGALTLKYSNGGVLSQVQLTATSVQITQSGNSASITLDNSGNAVFTALGSSSNIQGGSMSGQTLAFAGTCSFGTNNQTVTIGGASSNPCVRFNGVTSTTASSPSPTSFLWVQVNGNAKKIPVYDF